MSAEVGAAAAPPAPPAPNLANMKPGDARHAREMRNWTRKFAGMSAHSKGGLNMTAYGCLLAAGLKDNRLLTLELDTKLGELASLYEDGDDKYKNDAMVLEALDLCFVPEGNLMMYLQKVLMAVNSDYIANVTWPPGAEGRVQLLSNLADLVYEAAELFGEEAVADLGEPLVYAALRLCKDKVFGKGAADLLKELPVEEGLGEVGTAPFGKAMTALRDFANGESAHRVRLTTVEQIFAGAHGKGWMPASGTKGRKGEDAKSAGKPDLKDKAAPPNSGGADEAKTICYNCHGFGHKKAECPQKEKEQQPSWAKKAAGAAGSGAAGAAPHSRHASGGSADGGGGSPRGPM